MSDYSDQRMHAAGRVKVAACAVAAALTVGLGLGPAALAQSSTPMASPTATCTAPALPPGTPTAAGTPTMDNMNMGDMGTPAAASPEATAAPAGTPADEATAAQIVAAAENIAACGNSNNVEGLVALMTPDFLQEFFGSANPYDAVAGIKDQGGAPFGDFKATNAQTYADGSVSVDTSYMGTKYQLSAERWTLVKDGDYWKINHIETMTPQTDLDTSVVGVKLEGHKDEKTGKMVYSITPATYNPDTKESHITAAPALDLHATNLAAGAEDHELIVFKLPAGMTIDQALSGTADMSQVEFIGQVTVPAGTEQDLMLINLPAGEYTLACFFTGPDGQPHAMNGMVATLTVDPAS